MSNIKKLQSYIEKQLTEMCVNIENNFKGNMLNRKNNPFNGFNYYDDSDIVKYMMLGRSFDSQLGNKLQKIAMFSARLRYGKVNVPNVIAMYWENEKIYINTVSFPMDEKNSQRVFWVSDMQEARNKMDGGMKRFIKKYPDKVYEQSVIFECSKEKADEIKGYLKSKSGTPVDLLHLEKNEKMYTITTYEIKSGGNLDTKNTESNVNEVKRLEVIFSVFNSNFSFFATCYNNRGEGNIPDGDIFNDLPEKNLIIGKAFWENILPKDISYEEFMDIYKIAFKKSGIKDMIERL